MIIRTEHVNSSNYKFSYFQKKNFLQRKNNEKIIEGFEKLLQQEIAKLNSN